jgi:hypothetical protein
MNSNKLQVIQPLVGGPSHGEKGKLYDASSPLMKTQKVWSDRKARVFVLVFKCLRLAFFLYGPFAVFVITSDFVSIGVKLSFIGGLFIWFVSLFLFAIRTGFHWESPQPLTAGEICVLYGKVTNFPDQKQIIQEAVRQDQTLRNRDLAFVNLICEELDRYQKEKDEREWRQQVLYDIKHDY